MAQATVTPNGLAATLSKSLGRPITAKMVRSLARSILPQYDKVKHEAYQSHGYTVAQVKTLTAAMRARGSRTASAATVKVKARAVKRATVKPAVQSDATA
jgi:pantothenate kinase-related protein Tda10